jgi:carbon-monoxide dehydrogenase medium subunit
MEEAISFLDAHPKTAVIAGGTDLVVNMKKKTVSPEHVLSLSKINALGKIQEERGFIRIGACVTVSDIIDTPLFPKSMRALVQSAQNLGTPLIRNRATIGGNIMSARPAADLICSLLALEADVELLSHAGHRIIPLSELLKGPGITTARPGEILVSILIEMHPDRTGSDYQGLGIRKTHEINLINVSAVLTLDADEIVQRARVAVGCVGPTHILSESAAKILEGRKILSEMVEESAAACVDDCAPIDDFRSTAEYRNKMARVMTKRALYQAWKHAVDA